MKSAIVFGIIALGLLLVVLSGIWGTMFNGSAAWTKEKQDRSSEVKSKLHNMSFVLNAPKPQLHAGQDLGQMKLEYEQLKKENEQLNAEFTSAADTPKSVASALKWTGLSLAVVGVIGWYAVNQSR
jgi:hypothetical protein